MTRRQLVASAAAGVVGLLVAVAGIAGRTDMAAAGLGVLLAGLLVLTVDVRRRQGDIAKRLKQVAHRQRVDSRQIGRMRSLPRELELAARRSSRSLSEEIGLVIGRVEAAGEAALAGIAQERLGATERHLELIDQFGRMQADLGEVTSQVAGVKDDVAGTRDHLLARLDEAEQGSKRRQVAIREHIGRLGYEPVRQVQALLQLVQRVQPRAPLPPTGGWAMEPSTLLRLVEHVERSRPGLVVECGSGTSTVWLGYALESLGAGRVVALEHDERFAARTRQMLDEHGLGEIAQVRTAPLVDVKLGDATYAWYDHEAVQDLEGIELLLVDGPPRASGPRARYPALPLLRPKLASGASIVLDDVDRPDEQEAAEAWLAETPELVRESNGGDRSAWLTYRPG